MAQPWEMDWTRGASANPYTNGPDPERVRRMREEEERRAREEQRANAGLGIQQRGEGRQQGNDLFAHTDKLASAYNADPSVKAYRVAIAQFGQALGTGQGPQNDLALTYAFAKAMDPESVVRESEQNMVTDSQPWFQTMVERTKKQFGMDGAGNYTPEARQALRQQISNAVAQRAKVYDARRNFYEQQAQAFGLDPRLIVGEHDARPFVPAIQQWVERSNKREPEGLTNTAAPDGQELLGYGRDEQGNPYPVYGFRSPGGGNPLAGDPNFQQSPVGQGMSGVNESIAGTLGLPFDITGAVDTGLTKGINAAFGTDLKTADEAYGQNLGDGDWWQGKFREWGFTGPPPTTDTGAFARRVGQSVGAAAMPVAGAGVGVGRAALGLGAAAGGGAGAATAQQVFPGNPAAEFAGELIGSAGTGFGMARMGQAARQRGTNSQVPTVEQLKEEARQLYQQAEARGRAAPPSRTRKLAREMRLTLRREGQLGPNGRITDADTSTSKAFNLIEQYAGQKMTPTEMNTVRTVIADGRNSADPSDQRLAKIMLDQFDEWVRPLAPEFDQARAISSRYLQAQDLEQARELAGVRAGQFTGSGFENALRTEYRALDRNTVKGRDWFSPEVSAAIQDVSRGTTASNVARAAGRFAPTGPVSAAMGTGVPAAVGMALGGPAGGVAAGTTAAAIGTGGRMAATRMGMNNAARAELIARNGGSIPQAGMMTPEAERLIAALALAQLSQNGDPNDPENHPGGYYPNPFAGAEYQPRRGLFGGLR